MNRKEEKFKEGNRRLLPEANWIVERAKPKEETFRQLEVETLRKEQDIDERGVL